MDRPFAPHAGGVSCRAPFGRSSSTLETWSSWEQRVPERPPVPDEGRASLRIELGNLEGGFWEWYNDLGEHDRLLRVSALLADLVPR
jgi:hypothetical protein